MGTVSSRADNGWREWMMLERWSAAFEAATGSWPVWGTAWLVGVLSVAVSLFLYAPMLWAWSDAFFAASRTNDFLLLCEQPLRRDLAEPILAYRLVVPVLCKILGLTGYICFVPQFLANIGAHAAIYVAVLRFYRPVTAFWAALLLALSSFSITSNTWMGVPDSVTLLCAALMLGATSARWGWLWVLLGALNDERMCLALPFVAFWWYFHEPTSKRLRSLGVSIAAGMAAWMVIRVALRDGWIGAGIAQPKVYGDFWNLVREFHPTGRSWGVFLANILLGYRWLWMLPVLFIARAAWPGPSQRAILPASPVRWGFASGLALAALALTGAGDVTRMTAFFFPAVLLPLCWWLERMLPHQGGYWVRGMLLALVLTPGIYFGSNAHLQISFPLPLVLIRMLI